VARKGDFLMSTKHAVIKRQSGVCAFCGVSLDTPLSDGEYKGYAHHLKPLRHGDDLSTDNCVYLCWGITCFWGMEWLPLALTPKAAAQMSGYRWNRRIFNIGTVDYYLGDFPFLCIFRQSLGLIYFPHATTYPFSLPCFAFCFPIQFQINPSW